MRCPVCNEKDCYLQEMLTMGIAVPEKLAALVPLVLPVQVVWFCVWLPLLGTQSGS